MLVSHFRLTTQREISRVKLYDYITYLNDAKLISIVDEQSSGLSKLVKPPKNLYE